jgi:hypothetical protein
MASDTHTAHGGTPHTAVLHYYTGHASTVKKTGPTGQGRGGAASMAACMRASLRRRELSRTATVWLDATTTPTHDPSPCSAEHSWLGDTTDCPKPKDPRVYDASRCIPAFTIGAEVRATDRKMHPPCGAGQIEMLAVSSRVKCSSVLLLLLNCFIHRRCG